MKNENLKLDETFYGATVLRQKRILKRFDQIVSFTSFNFLGLKFLFCSLSESQLNSSFSFFWKSSRTEDWWKLYNSETKLVGSVYNNKTTFNYIWHHFQLSWHHVFAFIKWLYSKEEPQCYAQSFARKPGVQLRSSTVIFEQQHTALVELGRVSFRDSCKTWKRTLQESSIIDRYTARFLHIRPLVSMILKDCA